LSGGNITLVVPGCIDVGLANPPSLISDRSLPRWASSPKARATRHLCESSVNVNALAYFHWARHIEIWSNEGSIDAGRRLQTAVFAATTTVLINTDGSVTLDFLGRCLGQRHRHHPTNPSFALGNVRFVRARGSIDAGDAGIPAAGISRRGNGSSHRQT